MSALGAAGQVPLHTNPVLAVVLITPELVQAKLADPTVGALESEADKVLPTLIIWGADVTNEQIAPLGEPQEKVVPVGMAQATTSHVASLNALLEMAPLVHKKRALPVKGAALSLNVKLLPELMITLVVNVEEQERPPTFQVRLTSEVTIQGLASQLSCVLRVSPVPTQSEVVGVDAPVEHTEVRV